ncbi:MAG: PIN domain-containing protein [Acidobacteriota bacterium]|nr:PIN domain-containing protein [Acidobacteriota bacterium]
MAFLRIGTNPRALTNPLSTTEAITIITEWLSQPGVGILNPGEGHWAILGAMLASVQARGPLVMDAHLASLAMEHGATLCTNDRDFTRFVGLKVMNPLEPN